jgi:hypothetical protein
LFFLSLFRPLWSRYARNRTETARQPLDTQRGEEAWRHPGRRPDRYGGFRGFPCKSSNRLWSLRIESLRIKSLRIESLLIQIVVLFEFISAASVTLCSDLSQDRQNVCRSVCV